MIHRTGGPEVMSYETAEAVPPGTGEVRVRHTAIGVNFIDVYHRTGLYELPLPSGLGVEGAGIVEAVGAGVPGLVAGDRVGYCLGKVGAYSSTRLVSAERLLRLPDGIDAETAAAVLLKGLTVWYLLRRLRPLRPGDPILVHAAAGGVGSILTQWAHRLGARVIATVGSPEKAERARANGADEVILYRQEDVPTRVRELTGGRGVAVVYDSVGRDTFDSSLDSLERFGLMVSFGNASGPVPPVTPLKLMEKGSLFLTRPLLAHYIETRQELEAGASELFDLILTEGIRPFVGQRYPLSRAAEAHRALERGSTFGSTVLIP
ncbi:MAG: quinone oxidoreductase family protein [Aeromicrobium sp.]